MSTAVAQDVLDRTMTDRQFADRLRADPDAVLEEYDLPEAEAEALSSGKESRVREVLGDLMADKVAVVVIVIG